MTTLRLRAIKPIDWPECDRRLWSLAKLPPEDIDDGGRASAWSLSTVSNCEFFYGQYLRFLKMRGQLDTSAAPIDRSRMELIREFLAAYQPGHAETSCAMALVSIEMVVRACHPPDGNADLRGFAQRRQERARPCLPKVTRTATLAELIDLGEQLMDRGREMLLGGHQGGATTFRNGLMIAMLTVHPIRRRNFAALQIGKTLLLEGDDVVVRFCADETKNSIEIERVYPSFMRSYVRDYIRHVRPILREGVGEPDDGHLWIGRQGTKMVPQALRVVVIKETQKHLGRTVPPHLFRDSVATGIAIHDPQHVGVARIVLGHRDYRTTEKYYIKADSVSAFARYQAALKRRRLQK